MTCQDDGLDIMFLIKIPIKLVPASISILLEMLPKNYILLYDSFRMIKTSYYPVHTHQSIPLYKNTFPNNKKYKHSFLIFKNTIIHYHIWLLKYDSFLIDLSLKWTLFKLIYSPINRYPDQSDLITINNHQQIDKKNIRRIFKLELNLKILYQLNKSQLIRGITNLNFHRHT